MKNRLQILSAAMVGVLFGIGLLIAGMADPAKVLGFFDTERWDPTLAFVMLGALAVASPGLFFFGRLRRSLLNGPLRLPDTRRIDRRLLGGSVLFGIGWGLAGICPGPALVLLGRAQDQAMLFVPAMLFGMALFQWLEQRRPRP